MDPLLNPTPSAGAAAAGGTGTKGSLLKQAGLLAAVAALLPVLWMPSAQGLPAAGH